MEKPIRAGDGPIMVNLEKEKDYYWCACGKSSNQPFCDGSHKGSEFSPVKFRVEEDVTKALCSCKGTQNAPYCDGSHRK